MLCLDTNALVEINNGNPAFTRLMEQDVVITDLLWKNFIQNNINDMMSRQQNIGIAS
jgi:hypothetical protein